MLDIIYRALRESGVEEYRINEETVSSYELFFIRKKLDMRRINEVHNYVVTVYRAFAEDGAEYKGMYAALVRPGMTQDEVNAVMADAYHAAAFVKNPTFPLPKGEKREAVSMPSALSGLPLPDAAWRMADALFAADTRDDAYINSAELFLKRRDARILSSAGIDVGYTSYLASGEFIVQAKEPQDVELYRWFEYRDLDTAALEKLAADALQTVRDRAAAVDAPKAGVYRVLLSDEHVIELLRNYPTRANAAYVYAGYSNYACGKTVQGDAVTGEKLNITLFGDVPFDEEGLEKKDRVLLRDGVLESLHGASRFCAYLGLEPVGSYDCIRVDNGSLPLAEMKRQPHLYVVSFSDFQLDVFSGHFGGEIRLGYLFDGEKTVPVTGGSISGSLLERQGNLVFSTERYRERNYDGPFAVMLEEVNVAGA